MKALYQTRISSINRPIRTPNLHYHILTPVTAQSVAYVDGLGAAGLVPIGVLAEGGEVAIGAFAGFLPCEADGLDLVDGVGGHVVVVSSRQ